MNPATRMLWAFGPACMHATALLASLLLWAAAAQAANPVVELTTSLGPVRIELYPDKAPKTVENFLQYARDRFYDGTIFHRVIPGFMVQGGGFTPDMEQKKTREPIANEAQNGLKNTTGTVAMARTPNPHSASAQFFINVADNEFLNFTGPTQQGFGYCVFGRVTQGMDVVSKIVAVPTGSRGGHQNVPVKPVVIQGVRIVNAN
jgi:peptidyl-prolyl cis-trans isomerase B (cyclophilin B)